MSEPLQLIWDQLPNLLWGFPNNRPGGLLLSIMLSAGAIVAGLGVAIGLAFARHSQWWLLRWVAGRIVWVVRGIPLIVLLVLLFQYLGTGALLGIEFSIFWSAFITLTLYSAAYQADIIGGGIAAVPQELRDDARVLGASRATVARTVTLPYALRTMQPALTTQAITIFKDSSVVTVLGVTELTKTAEFVINSRLGNTPHWVAVYLAVGFLYWCVAFGLARFAERRVRQTAAQLGSVYV